MPLDGEQLDEMLSGFVDGALTETELALLEEAARADARVAQRIEELRQQSSLVRHYGRGLAEQRSVSTGLAQRVIEVARLRGRAEGLPADHYIQPYTEAAVESAGKADSADVASMSVELAGRRPVVWVAWAGFVAAAAVLVAVAWPTWYRPDPLRLSKQDSQPVVQADPSASLANAANLHGEPIVADDLPPTDSPADERPLNNLTTEPAEESSSLVGKSAGMSYVLVIDVEITAKAQRNQAMEKILAAAGIPLAPPVAANSEVLEALDDSRLIVRNPTSTSHRIAVQVVRGDMQEIDLAFRNVWQDQESFPNVAMNLSIDSRANLMRAMLRGAESRFSPSDRFAMPLAMEPEAIGPEGVGTVATKLAAPSSGSGATSPFPGADGGVQYVSSSQRAGGWGGVGEMSAANRDSMTTILLVLHQVD